MRGRGDKFIYISLILTILLVGSSVYAQESTSEKIDTLRDQISDRTNKIEALEAEIEQYEQELEVVGEEKATLQTAIRSLDLSEGKIRAEKNITENRVSATTFQISKLALEITDKEDKIDLHSDTLAQSIRTINEVDNTTFIEQMLTTDDLSDLWEQVEDLQRFQTTLQATLFELKALKVELEDSKNEREARRRELLSYNQDLAEQERGIQVTKSEKNTLLSHTKNKESNYKSLLEDKKAARLQFERELLDFESQLKIAIDPNSIPSPNKNILSFPTKKPFVTQRFGHTEFSRANSSVYNGRGHNGIDLRAAIGDPIKAPLSGTIIATGNTDAISGCYSYGKWLLLRHNNGLTSLFAHLSEILMPEGTNVVTGQTVALSGNTGYSTAPHLHFGLFATQGVKVVRFGDIKAITNCADAYVPVAPHEAYLNPLDYLDY